MNGRAKLGFVIIAVALSACNKPLWITHSPETKVYTMRDVPIVELRRESEKYIGAAFQGRFKFYRIYQGIESVAEVKDRSQIVLGKTHFTARPIDQYGHVIRIRITPQQHEWFKSNGIERQDIINAKVRFAGVSVKQTIAFELLEVLAPMVNEQ